MALSRAVIATYIALVATVVVIFTHVWYSLSSSIPYDALAHDGQGKSDLGDLISSKEPSAKQMEVDRKYCGGPCRFLLPVFIAEQESKAQVHVRQLAFMSGLINRTFVLPNMEDSKLGACHKYDFYNYYDKAWVSQNSQHFSAITLSDFTNWLEERRAIDAPATSQDMVVHMERNMYEYNRRNCFATRMDMSDLPGRHLFLEEDYHSGRRSDIYERIIRQFLTGNRIDAPGDPDVYPSDAYIDLPTYIQGLDVLSVYYNRRSPIIQNPAAQEEIPFNPLITKLVDSIAAPVTPFWAIHWRMETIYPAERLLHCAYSLVSLIDTLAQKAKLAEPPTLFLLTDYPHVFDETIIQEGIASGKDGKQLGLKTASATFHPSILQADHHRAIQHLYHNLRLQVTAIENANLTGTPANWTVVPIPNEVTYGDPGMLGMIDKMLAIRSQIFIAGSQAVCARASSYTRRIVDERAELRLKEGKETKIDSGWHGWDIKDDTKIKNIVDYFEYPKGYVPPSA